MNTTIRKATLAEGSAVTPILLTAMEDIIYSFIGRQDRDEALTFLQSMYQSASNQYSYENIYVLTVDEKIIGVINLYEGKDLLSLRAPVNQYLNDNYSLTLTSELETQPGEIYIDSFAIDSHHWGNGYGRMLLTHILTHHPNPAALPFGLLVEIDNETAINLYQSLHFLPQGYKTLNHKRLLHLQTIITR